jgi:hypothetical protein
VALAALTVRPRAAGQRARTLGKDAANQAETARDGGDATADVARPCLPVFTSARYAAYVHAIARRPFLRITASSRSAGPPGRFTPLSQSDTRFLETLR